MATAKKGHTKKSGSTGKGSGGNAERPSGEGKSKKAAADKDPSSLVNVEGFSDR